MRARIACALVLAVCLPVAPSSGQPRGEGTVGFEWSGRQDAYWTGTRAPQVPRARALYRETPGLDAGAIRALLLCKIDIFSAERWDTLTPPDLLVTLLVGGTALAPAWGFDDHASVVVSFPGVPLREREPLELTVDDRDYLGNDRIGRVTLAYEGSFPVVGRARRFRVECRGRPTDELQPIVAPLLGTAEGALVRAAAAAPDLSENELGYPDLPMYLAKWNLNRAAGYVGWDDPNLHAGREHALRVEAAFREQTREALAAQAEEASPAGVPVLVAGTEMTASVERLTCDPEAIRAYVRSSHRRELRHASCLLWLFLVEEDVDRTPLDELRLSLVDERGRIAHALRRVVGSRSAEEIAVVAAFYAVPFDEASTRFLVRLRVKGQVTFLATPETERPRTHAGVTLRPKGGMPMRIRAR